MSADTRTEQQILDQIKEKSDMALLEDSLLDNFASFEQNNVKYRIVKPSFKHKQIVYDQQQAKFMELLNSNSNYMMEEQLIKTLKTKGIDLDDMQRKINELDVKRAKLQFQLGEMLKEKKGSDSDREKIATEIQEIANTQQLIALKRSKYLESSVENQVAVHSYSYLAFLICEKQVEDKWVSAFASYDEMLNADEILINNLILRAALIGRNEIK